MYLHSYITSSIRISLKLMGIVLLILIQSLFSFSFATFLIKLLFLLLVFECINCDVLQLLGVGDAKEPSVGELESEPLLYKLRLSHFC